MCRAQGTVMVKERAECVRTARLLLTETLGHACGRSVQVKVTRTARTSEIHGSSVMTGPGWNETHTMLASSSLAQRRTACTSEIHGSSVMTVPGSNETRTMLASSSLAQRRTARTSEIHGSSVMTGPGSNETRTMFASSSLAQQRIALLSNGTCVQTVHGLSKTLITAASMIVRITTTTNGGNATTRRCGSRRSTNATASGTVMMEVMNGIACISEDDERKQGKFLKPTNHVLLRRGHQKA